jgi:hypothetical protein
MPQVKVEGGSLHWNIDHDGARNTMFDIVGVCDGADLPATVVVDVSKLFSEPGYKITKLRIDDIQYFIEPGLLVELLWEGDGSEHLHCMKMTGRGTANYGKAGGRQNMLEGATGNIMIATSGAGEGRKTFSLQLELIKQFS